MSYYVYANIERTSYDGGALLKAFVTKEEALRCREEIIHITSTYETRDELVKAIVTGEYKIDIIDVEKHKIGLSAEDNAEEWLYNTYSELLTHHDGYLRDTVNKIVVIEGHVLGGSLYEL